MLKVSRFDLEYIVEPKVRRFCGPLFFTRSIQSAGSNVTNSGSFGLIDTGQKKLLTTCFHVWEKFEMERSEHPELKLCLCLDQREPVVFVAEKPIGKHPLLDICTFDIAPALQACEDHEFFPLHQNPGLKVRKGDVAYFIGFPAIQRSTTDNSITFGRQPFGARVTSVDGPRFHVDVSSLKDRAELLPGISGSPCFLVRTDSVVRLAGIVTTHLIKMGLVACTSVACVKPDGTIEE